MRIRPFLGLLLICIACADSIPAPTPVPPPGPLVAIVSLAPNDATVAVGDSVRIQVISNNLGETAWTWTSSNRSLASVGPTGWVRGEAAGDLMILACGQNQTTLCGGVTVHVR